MRATLLGLCLAVLGCGGEPKARLPAVDLPDGECLLLFDNESQVIGMDGAYSVPVGGGRSLFVFGDTFLGSWSAEGGRIFDGSVENSAAVVEDDAFERCFAGSRFVGGARAERMLEPPAGATARHRTWPGPGLASGSRLLLAFSHVREAPDAPFGFVAEGAGLAEGTIDPPRVQATTAKLIAPEPGFSAMLIEGESVYVYRCAPGSFFGGGWFPCVLGRAPLADASDPGAYAYFVEGLGFVGSLEEATVITEGAPEFTLGWNAYLEAFLMVYVEPFGRELSIRTAPRPEGPFSDRRAIWPCHLPAADPKGFCHGGKWHPQLGSPDGRRIVVTYNRNTDDGDVLAADPSAYFPHLAVVDLEGK